MTSIEIDITLHMVAELQRVFAHEPFSPLGVAGFKRSDDFLVINDRALDPLVLEDGALANGADVEEQAVGDLGNQRTAAEADDGLMKPDIGVGIFAGALRNLVN